jgi:hypothetical protein
MTWRVVYYPSPGFYMIWKDLETDWKEYGSREAAEHAIRSKSNERTTA